MRFLTDKESMKIIVSILVFLSSISSAAEEKRYDDGSYYNDDYIHDEDLQDTKVKEPSDTYNPNEGNAFGAPEIEKPKPKKPKKKRKPASLFKEVHVGGQVGDFKEVGGGHNSIHSRGSK